MIFSICVSTVHLIYSMTKVPAHTENENCLKFFNQKLHIDLISLFEY